MRSREAKQRISQYSSPGPEWVIAHVGELRARDAVWIGEDAERRETLR
jgi:hypothetical protein